MAASAMALIEGTIIPIGLSMGGMVALELWQQAPERIAAIALFDTDPGADTPARRAARDLQLLAATHGEFRNVIQTELKPAYFSPSNTNQALRQQVIDMALELGIGAFAAQLTALATRPDYWHLLPNVTVPTLVACGADDRICPPERHERMAKLLPQSQLAIIKDAGHLPTLEQADETTAVLKNWLNHIVKH